MSTDRQQTDRKKDRQQADKRRTDMTKLMVALFEFPNAPKSYNTMHLEKGNTIKFLHILS